MSLSHFQLYSEECHYHLQRLLLSMQQVYSQETKHLYKVFYPKKEMICVARYAKDNNWYRARVTGLPGHRRVEVFFVDYGNKSVVVHTDICKILDDHIKYPMQALRVSLADVQPAEHGFWSQEALDWFQSVAELQLCQFRVTKSDEAPNAIEGVLYAVNSSTNALCCVNYELVRRGFAKSTGPWSSSEFFKGITLRPEMASSPSSSATRSPLAGTYHIGSPDLTQMAGGEGVKSVVKSLGEVKEEGLEEGESRKLDKNTLEVVVCSYESPAQFYIQQHEKLSDLHSLMAEMRCYEKEPPCSRNWAVGEFCAAKSAHDHRWCRGCILGVREDGVYQVRLVDYGHIDEIPACHVKPLKSAHGKMECFVERCHIADLMPTGTTDRTKWSHTATEFFSKMIGLNRTCYVTLKGDRVPDMGLPVDILVEETSPATALEPVIVKYVSVAARLLDRGLAMPVRKEKLPQSPPVSDTLVIADMFTTKPTLTFHSAATSSQEEKEKLRMSEDGPGMANNLTVIQPHLEVAPHPPPISNQLRLAPVHVDSKGLIYAQDMAEGERCQAVIDVIQEYAQKEAPEGTLQVTEGQTCIAFCPAYGLWLRASVLKLDPKEVEVQYIDYGNIDHIPKTNLKLITPELCIQHQLVYLIRLQEIGQVTEDGSLPEEYSAFLNTYVLNKPFTALIQGSTEECPLVVDLIDDDSGVSALKSMVSAESVGSKEHILDLLYKRSNDIADVLKLSNPYTTVKLGNKDETVHALVSHLELPNVVFLQRCDDPVDGKYSQDMLDMGQLMEDLNNLPPQTPGLKELPDPGAMCSAHYREDNRWYRALVVRAYPEDLTVLVLYVDYGNSDILPLDRLRVLPQRFQSMEAQGVRAFLNLTLPEGCDRWTMDTYKAMAACVFNSKHRVLIKETMPLTVELYDREEGTTLSYASLIQDGLVAIPQPDERPCIEVAAEETSSGEENSTTSISPEQE